jgi:hypothetical protein
LLLVLKLLGEHLSLMPLHSTKTHRLDVLLELSLPLPLTVRGHTWCFTTSTGKCSLRLYVHRMLLHHATSMLQLLWMPSQHRAHRSLSLLFLPGRPWCTSRSKHAIGTIPVRTDRATVTVSLTDIAVLTTCTGKARGNCWGCC